jgi:hypothetical protein
MFDGTVDGLRQAVVAKMAKMQLRYRLRHVLDEMIDAGTMVDNQHAPRQCPKALFM